VKPVTQWVDPPSLGLSTPGPLTGSPIISLFSLQVPGYVMCPTYCGKSSVIWCQDAREPTKMWAVGSADLLRVVSPRCALQAMRSDPLLELPDNQT
jgi:hypothetical protein